MKRALPLAAVLIAASLLLPARVSSAETRARACGSRVAFGALPEWARSGFSGSTRMPHVVGRDGRIAALVFGYPLYTPPLPARRNKILWVARRAPASAGALWIHAQRMAGSRLVGAPVTRVVRGGPGPSIVDLPDAGCWRLTVSWSGGRDTLDLRYRPR